MERSNAYMVIREPGNVTFDVKGMAIDLVTLLKGGRYFTTKDEFVTAMAEMWDAVQVQVKRPTDN